MSIEVTLPLRTVSEANQRGHWSKGAKRAKEQRSVVALALGPHLRKVVAAHLGIAPALRYGLAVTLTRIGPRRLDGDNLQRALKAVRDGVADALGVDDGDERIEWRYEQLYAGEGPKGYGVQIRIGALSSSPTAREQQGVNRDVKSLGGPRG
jgi:hypothetical protein